MRKILISPGYGAGWSSWNSGEVARFMLEYQPIIDFIEQGNKFTSNECHSDDQTHPLLKQLEDECKEKFGCDYVCVLGANTLKVLTVNGPVRIHEYDGSESIEEPGDFQDWM